MACGVSGTFEDILKLRRISPAFSSEKIYEHLQANNMPEGKVKSLLEFVDTDTELCKQRKNQGLKRFAAELNQALRTEGFEIALSESDIPVETLPATREKNSGEVWADFKKRTAFL